MFSYPNPNLAIAVFFAATANAQLITITTHVSACSTSAAPTCTPSHFADHCGFDARRNARIGFVDLADPDVRQRYYPSNSDQWLTDDMPYRVTPKTHHNRRWYWRGIWNDIKGGIDNAFDFVEDTGESVSLAAEAGRDATSTWVADGSQCVAE